jgi:hypothetical protein
MTITNSIGPVPIDDYVQVFVNDPISGRNLCGGSAKCNGFLNCNVMLGSFDGAGVNQYGSGGVVDNAAVNFTFSWRHANGALVANGTNNGVYTWDATSNLWALVRQGGTSFLADIRKAVYRVFSNA